MGGSEPNEVRRDIPLPMGGVVWDWDGAADEWIDPYEAGFLRSFEGGLPVFLHEPPDMVPESSEQQQFADVSVDLTDKWRGSGLEHLREKIFHLSTGSRRTDESGYDDLTVLDVLELCLVLSVDYGETVHRGQQIGWWCGEEIIAPASGHIAFLASVPNRYLQGDECLAELEASERDNDSGFPGRGWLYDEQKDCDFLSGAELHDWTWIVAVIAVDKSAPRVAPKAPDPVLIRSPQDAEEAAARWMRFWGWSDARTTPAGADEGIDVVARDAVAQVKAHMNPVGRPDVQNLFGVACAEKKDALFFALSDFTPEARGWADKAGVGLFRFDLQGQPEPINPRAKALVIRQQA